jgi:hypothetical protein
MPLEKQGVYVSLRNALAPQKKNGKHDSSKDLVEKSSH